jgi:hypothetical protein
MIALMYRSFGKEPPAGPQGLVAWLLALAFVASSLLMLAVFNFFSLFFGVFVNFLGRDGVKFNFIHLFRRVPIIGIAPLVLIGYAFWQNAAMHGTWRVVMMPLLTAVAAIVLIAGAVGVNRLLGRRRG